MNTQTISLLLIAAAITACSPQPSTQHSSTQTQPLSHKKSTEVSYKDPDAIQALEYVEHNIVYNPESVIPPQCYTKTESKHNPCYVCHQTYPTSAKRPNFMFDGHLQGTYAFSDLGTKNHWKNLFKDRTEQVADITDDFIQSYTQEDNYSRLIQRLQRADWQGEIAEIKQLAFPEKAFAKNGLAKDGSHWVAFNYKPFPSTFWPTNGSTGDVMLRLPAKFRELGGQYNEAVYFANLTLLEMAIKNKSSLSLPVMSEVTVGMDLNGNKKIDSKVTSMVRQRSFIGDAADVKVTDFLYPEGTEILHTVRYIGVKEDGTIYNAPRLKELRYMKKQVFLPPNQLKAPYYQEQKEKDSENLPKTTYHGDEGIANNFGWVINAYIEDAQGELRQQNRQELAFCNGCHKSIGSTIDQTFSFPRKLDGAAGWGYIDLSKLHDAPNVGEVVGEYLTYLERVGGGDEFRQNTEMLERWFLPNGEVNKEKVQGVRSLYEFLTPSVQRAQQLNKTYYTIVKEQSYLFGRDATWLPSNNVHKQVDETQQPLPPEHHYKWDMRLDWQATQ